MTFYLPVAEMSANILIFLAMSAAVGFLSGLFGVGGGFLMTPLLIFIGIGPAVAVASVASHIAASSFSGAINYWRRRAIDPALAAWLLTGGDPRAVLWALPALNWAAVVVLAWLGAVLAAHYGRSPWWGFVLVLAVNVCPAALRDLTDPVAKDLVKQMVAALADAARSKK